LEDFASDCQKARKYYIKQFSRFYLEDTLLDKSLVVEDIGWKFASVAIKAVQYRE
jgi:hypothetical protein